MRQLLFLLLFPLFVYSQYCPSLGPDQYLPCGVNSTTLTADLSQCNTNGVNPNQTTSYNVTSIPYIPQNNTGTLVNLTDDSQAGPFNIGFTFCFFGNTYNQFYIGSNGWISFTAGQPTTFTSTPIPSANVNIPKNCIMSPWQDWHPGLGGQIRYQVQGTAPCRKLVVSWINVPMFSCTSNFGTFHIVIYESTNYIENYIQSKPNCTQWAGGTAVQGIHNLAGTTAVTVPGRNSTVWTVTNDAQRYTPSGPIVSPTLTWYQVGNPNPIGTGPSITVTPPQAGANYTCQFVYPTCNAGWSSCMGGVGNLGPDTVFVQPGPPSLPQPIVTITNPTCNQYCDGSIDVVPVGGNGIQTISWNGGLPNSFNVNTLCSGNYFFTIVDALGCSVTGNATLVDPPIITINQILGSDTVCYNSTDNLYEVPNPSSNLSYLWTSTIGNISSGQGTSQINLDVTGVNGGLYNNTLSVIGVNSLGCESQPQTFTIFDLDIIPIINQIGPFCEYDDCVTLNASPIGGSFFGSNVFNTQYCPNSGFIGSDQVTYTYTQSNCVFESSISVQVYSRPVITPIINDIVGEYDQYHEICEGDSVSDVFGLNSLGNGSNEWYVFGDTITSQTLNLTWDTDGIFNFQAVTWDNGCVSDPQTFTVSIGLCPSEIFYIPNAFTPNGDEKNNTFKPIITSGVDFYNYNLLVYNRWGQIIWESNNPYFGWDGTFNGFMCQDGIYTWKLTFKVPQNDNRKEYHGFLTLIK